MSSVEKNKKAKKEKKSKKTKKAKAEKSAKVENQDSEVLERVMDSIEMAGASLDFFEEDAPVENVELASEENTTEELEATSGESVDGELEAATKEGIASEELETDGVEAIAEEANPDITEPEDEVTEAQAFEIPSEDLSDGETLEMLPDESTDEFIEQKQATLIRRGVDFEI